MTHANGQSAAAHAKYVPPSPASLAGLRTIATLPRLIDALGGPDAVATWAGVMPQTVGSWLKQGSMPTGFQLRAFLRATAIGFTVDPVTFGLRADGDPTSAHEVRS